MSSQFYMLVTTLGLVEFANASQSSAAQVAITHMAFGDANGATPIPTVGRTALINERARIGVNSVSQNATNPNWIETEAIIPATIGGFTIREVGLYAGTKLVAYGNYPSTFKPLPTDGTSRIMTIKAIIQLDNPAAVQMVIDPSIVLATKKYVDDRITFNNMAGMRPYLTKAALDAYAGSDKTTFIGQVTNDTDTTKNGNYVWNTTTSTWIPTLYDPYKTAMALTDVTKASLDTEVAKRKSIINESTDGALHITGSDNFDLAVLTNIFAKFFLDIEAKKISGDSVSLGTTDFSVISGDFFELLRLNADSINTVGVKVTREFNGWRVVDGDGFIINQFPPDATIPVSTGSSQTPLSQAMAQLLPNRHRLTNIIGIHSYGQSLNLAAGSTVTLSSTQPYSNLMFAGGVFTQPGNNDYIGNAFAPLIPGPCYALVDRFEPHVVGACNGLSKRLADAGYDPNQWQFLATIGGWGGRSVEDLTYDENRLNMFKQMITDAYNTATAAGKTYECWAMPFIQGEANIAQGEDDEAGDANRYIDRFTYLIDLQTQHVAATVKNQRGLPYVPIYQVSAHRKYGKDYMNISLAHWRLSKEHDQVILFAPNYMFPTSDDQLHLSSIGYWLMGQYEARAIYYTMVERNGKFRPLEPVAVSWSDTQIVIRFNKTGLVLDTALCTMTQNSGFDVRENNAVVSIITGVAVTAPDTVTISLSRAPAATAVLTYARGRVGDPVASGPVDGPRGNLRDSAGTYDTATLPDGSQTFALHNASVMFEHSRINGFL